MTIYGCEQASPEWYECRRGIATASCFAEILAKGKNGAEATGRRNYRAKLVVERLSGKIVEGYKSRAMDQGTEREPLAREAYMVATGNFVERAGFFRHDTIEAGASPDGLIGAEGGIECKCPELSAHIDYLQRNDEPPEYRAQIQGNMWLTGRVWWDFISWNPDFPPSLQLVIRRVVRDEAYIARLELAVRRFIVEVYAHEAELRRMLA